MSEYEVRPRRSLLFVPGLRPDRYRKALDAGADIVCIDLEDAVALPRKAEAREMTMPLFADDTHPNVERMVRINGLSTPDGLKDLTAIIESGSPPPSIMIPKIRWLNRHYFLCHFLKGNGNVSIDPKNKLVVRHFDDRGIHFVDLL